MCHMMQWNQILYEIALIFQTLEVYKWVTRLQKVFNSNFGIIWRTVEGDATESYINDMYDFEPRVSTRMQP